MSATEQTARTSIAALKSQSNSQEMQNLPAVSVGFNDLKSFELTVRIAKVLAASSLVPEAYRDNLANCSIALNMASRIGADPLLVMQNLYIVHGNPGWSSKFLIACVNTCGRFSALRYEWRGTSGTDEYGCRAWAIEKDTKERLNGVWIDWRMVKAEGWHKKNGSKWNTMPDQMFVYRSAAFWARAYAPELSMGLQTAEELSDTFEARRNATGTFEVDLGDLRQSGAVAGEATGEVLQNGDDRCRRRHMAPRADPSRSSATPRPSNTSRAPTTLKNLDERWKDLDADYAATRRSMPITVEAAKFERSEALRQAQK
jgi:hypothetical protein